MKVLAVQNWDEFQHYKDRDPPWVKLYRDLLTSESWVLGTDLSRTVQVASMMLAARYKNKIPLRLDLLIKVMSLTCSDQKLQDALQHLIDTNFLEIQEVTEERKDVEQSASKALASCASEKSREDQIRSEKNPSASSTPTQLVPRETLGWFLEFKLAYPERTGDPGWRKAERAANARMAEGHTAEEFLSGAQRYAAYCLATATEPQYVKQAATFLGPDKPFLLPWKVPANKAERQLDSNISAGLTFLAGGQS